MASIDQINAFIAVYETQGYSAAARQLNKSRTTVRELILTLEDQLNIQLFEIDGRKVIASKEAEKLHFHAKLLQIQMSLFHDLVETLHVYQEEQITLYYDPMLSSDFMADLSLRLNQKFPLLKLKWQRGDWQTSLSETAKSVSCISFLPNKKRSFPESNIELKLLGFQNYHFYTAKGGPLTQLEVVDKSHLRNHTQVLHHNIINHDHGDYMRLSAHYISVETNDDICRLIAKFGWAIVPDSFAAPYVAQGLIEVFTPDVIVNDYKMSVAAYFCSAINRGPAMSYLLDLLPELATTYFD